MFSKFLLGRLRTDDSVREVLGRTPLDLIARHAVCDFGDVSERRFRQNLIALEEAGEIMSEYPADPTDPKAGRIRITTTEGWGETWVAWVKYQPKKGKANDLPV